MLLAEVSSLHGGMGASPRPGSHACSMFGCTPEVDGVYAPSLPCPEKNVQALFWKSHIKSRSFGQFHKDICKLLKSKRLDTNNKGVVQRFFQHLKYTNSESITIARRVSRQSKAGTLPCPPSTSTRQKRGAINPANIVNGAPSLAFVFGQIMNDTVILIETKMHTLELSEALEHWQSYLTSKCYWPCVQKLLELGGEKFARWTGRFGLNTQELCPVSLEKLPNATKRDFGLDDPSTRPNNMFWSRLANLLRLECRTSAWTKLHKQHLEAEVEKGANTTQRLEENLSTQLKYLIEHTEEAPADLERPKELLEKMEELEEELKNLTEQQKRMQEEQKQLSSWISLLSATIMGIVVGAVGGLIPRSFCRNTRAVPPISDDAVSESIPLDTHASSVMHAGENTT